MIPFDEYYWTLKHEFPGDTDFTSDNYWKLPYEYVISAVNNALKLRRQRLHDYEKPIALLIAHQAEINRDRKKRKEPYRMDDFFLFGDPEQQNLPDAKYGAAAKVLIERQQFPSWALFVYKDLKRVQDDAVAPELLAFQHEDAIILAPESSDGECKGLLIARVSVSDQKITLKSERGDQITVRMPKIDKEVIANENFRLDILKYMSHNQNT